MILLDADGPGEIRHLWVTMPPWRPGEEAYAPQKTVLRAYWDGEAHPSVEVPLGNFFGVCFSAAPVFQSALITVNPEAAMNGYFPMPFAKHARLTVTYEGDKPVDDFYWNIDWVKRDSLKSPTANWHQDVCGSRHAATAQAYLFMFISGGAAGRCFFLIISPATTEVVTDELHGRLRQPTKAYPAQPDHDLQYAEDRRRD